MMKAFLWTAVAALANAEQFAITSHSYSIEDTPTLLKACQAEFGPQAQTIDFDSLEQGATWREIVAALPTLQRFTHYWALGSSDYLEATSHSKGVVVEYLWGDDVLPVLMGDAEMPSFLKVQVLCRGAAAAVDKSAPAVNLKASSYGHLHIETWSGDKMDFKKASNCDLVLVDHPSFWNGLGLVIQVQTKTTPLWSYIDSAVVQIGSDKLQVQGGDANHYWVNGVYQADLEGLDFPVTFQKVNARQSEFGVQLGDGNSIGIKTFHQYVRVDLQTTPTANVFVGSVGLMGSFPDGLWIGREAVMEDLQEFAQEWIVQDSKSLFQTPSDGCQLEIDVPEPKEEEEEEDHSLSPFRALRRRLTEQLSGLSPKNRAAIRGMTQTDAEGACGRVHREHPERIGACVTGLMEMVAAHKSSNNVDGAFADVYHALFFNIDSEATPTDAPTATPSDAPSGSPSDAPSESPSDAPSGSPTDAPSESPSGAPSGSPTDAPSESPSGAPSGSPTDAPSESPTEEEEDSAVFVETDK